MFCTNCGAQVSEGNAFCTNCGKPIAAFNRASVKDLADEMRPVAPEPDYSATSPLMDNAFQVDDTYIPVQSAQPAPARPAPAQSAYVAGNTAVMPAVEQRQAGVNTGGPTVMTNASAKPKKKTPLIIGIVVAVVAVVVVAALALSGAFRSECTVTFETNGAATIQPVKVEKGGTLATPQDPTREGYSFTGWYEDKDCKRQVVFPLTVDKDMTLYAGWDEMVSTEATGKSYETEAAARAALLSYYQLLEKDGDKLYSFVQDVAKPSVDGSLAQRQSAYNDFTTLYNEIIADLKNASGTWSVSGIKIPSSFAGVQGDEIAASELLVDRLTIIKNGFDAICSMSDKATSDELWNAWNSACNDSHAKYVAFTDKMNSIKSALS